jgi:hypothetical protein
MRTKTSLVASLFVCASVFIFSCQKGTDPAFKHVEKPSSESAPAFDLNVKLKGFHNSQGHIKFRQDPDPAKIIDLHIKVHNLLPNHEYLLQRAVDAINEVDGNCTSTSWLTLGKGLTPQTIRTDKNGHAEEALWRDVTAIASGSTFDIHFQVIDATSLEVVLTSDCYKYKVR